MHTLGCPASGPAPAWAPLQHAGQRSRRGGGRGDVPGGPGAAALAATPWSSAVPPHYPQLLPLDPGSDWGHRASPWGLSICPLGHARFHTHTPQCPCSQDAHPSPSPSSVSAPPSQPSTLRVWALTQKPPSQTGPFQGLTRQQHRPCGAPLVHGSWLSLASGPRPDPQGAAPFGLGGGGADGAGRQGGSKAEEACSVSADRLCPEQSPETPAERSRAASQGCPARHGSTMRPPSPSPQPPPAGSRLSRCRWEPRSGGWRVAATSCLSLTVQLLQGPGIEGFLAHGDLCPGQQSRPQTPRGSQPHRGCPRSFTPSLSRLH